MNHFSLAPSRRSRSAFSLIEILLVIAIMGILVSVVVINADAFFGGAQKDAARTFVNSQDPVLLKYRMDMKRYPTTEEGLSALVTKPANAGSKWSGPYIERMPEDPWGNPYQYRFPGQKNPDKYDLYSLGPDGVESADDIGNWEE